MSKAMLAERPHPRRPLLVMEVAQSSLRYDREVKSHLYACMGIQEYWVLNVVDRQLEVFTDPAPEAGALFGHAYRGRQLHQESEQVRARFAPDVLVPVTDMLPEL